MIFSVVSVIAMAQKTNVTGKVTDGSGEPLAGVFVLQKDTDNGTSTNASGEYSINVPADASLIFTSIGFREIIVPVRGYKTIDVTLEEDSQMLDETVVIGYGSQKSRDLTAPIVNIKGDDLTRQTQTTTLLRCRHGIHPDPPRRNIGALHSLSCGNESHATPRNQQMLDTL